MKVKLSIFLLLVFITQGLMVDYNIGIDQNDIYQRLSYSAHDPIFIDGDAALNTTVQNEGWTGSGVEDDPYIIEDYFISERVLVDTTYEVSITLKNVHQHVQISENLLRSSTKTLGTGIYLEGCTNISILNNDIEFYSIAFLIFNSDDITLVSNNVFDVTAGCYLETLGEVAFENNFFSNCSQYSFNIKNSDKVNFTSNIVKFSAIDFMSPNPNIFDNIDSLFVYNNTFSNIESYGLLITSLSNAEILSNTFIHCK